MGTFSINTVISVSAVTGNVIGRVRGVGAGYVNTDAARILGVNQNSSAIPSGNYSTLALSYNKQTPFDGSFSTSFTASFGYDLTSAIISLDGAANISYNNVPAGLTPTAAQLNFYYRMQDGQPTNTATYTLGSNTGTHSMNNLAVPLLISNVVSYAVVPSLQTILTNGFSISCASLGLQNQPYEIMQLSISGTYTATVWYFNPNTNHYQYAAVNPGAPWITSNPSFAETAVLPATGTTLGGS